MTTIKPHFGARFIPNATPSRSSIPTSMAAPNQRRVPSFAPVDQTRAIPIMSPISVTLGERGIIKKHNIEANEHPYPIEDPKPELTFKEERHGNQTFQSGGSSQNHKRIDSQTQNEFKEEIRRRERLLKADQQRQKGEITDAQFKI